MKKYLITALMLVMVLVVSACSSSPQVNEKNTDSTTASSETSATRPKLEIKASFYPMYEFTRQVAGDRANVDILIPANVEPHEWEPTAQDIAEITNADLLVYNGAGMEGWVDQILSSTTGSKLAVVEASKGLQIMDGIAEEEGSEGEHEEGHADHDSHDHGDLDPHVWLSPALAIQEVRNIQQELSRLSPDDATVFEANANAYIAQLEKLDQEFRQGLKNTKRKDFITQHAAFGYLAREYGLTQVPIAGLAPDQEPSAKKMSEIVNFAKTHHVKTIFFETLVSSSFADTIASEIGAKSAVLDPLEGITDQEKAQNVNYLSIMRNNLAALQKALNE
ncbi:metal ABC transporter substrate-binding protein [Paenibacillus dauci]|uniref:metal ABC transporter substrate-binding protein n=1 Tax=Paenibacillus dauci TaxID=1567106 RepID=UPI0006199449|nr:metal ABC transporter substrate-binding protein [Paenibacillus dauci]